LAKAKISGLGYKLMECIQHGHRVAIWRAESPQHGSVVIKVLQNSPFLASELAVGLASAHPNVGPAVAWHWVVIGGWQACVIVMDNRDGYTELTNHIYPAAGAAAIDGSCSTPHSNRLRKRLCLQLLEGVAYLHDVLRVAHRDIKTNNIVVTADLAKLRLIDHGFCLFHDPQCAPVPEALREPSRSDRPPTLGPAWWQTKLYKYCVTRNARMGTLGYMAPEVMYHQGGDDLFRADMYSVGATMFEIFFASEAWGDGHFYAKLRDKGQSRLQAKLLDDDHWRRFDAKYRLRKPAHKTVDPQAWVMIKALMQSNPRHRPTAAETLAKFRAWLAAE
jgi:serine/threonine protein kinase